MLKWSLVRSVYIQDEVEEVVLFTSEEIDECKAVIGVNVAEWCLKNPSERFDVVYALSSGIMFFTDTQLVTFDVKLAEGE